MRDNKMIISNENNINNVSSDNKTFNKKNKRSTNIIKVALYMLKKNKTTPSKSKKFKSTPNLADATIETISRLVGSVRPLYLQDGFIGGQSPPPPPLPPFAPQLSPGESSPEWNDTMVGMSPYVYEPSPLHSCSSYSSLSEASCSSSTGGMSRLYGSAQSLCDLDDHGVEGDEMIDSKAEMFISKMYQQMRTQDTP